MARPMRVELSEDPTALADAGLRCVGLFTGDDLPPDLAGAPGADDVRAKYKSLSVLRPDGRRVARRRPRRPRRVRPRAGARRRRPRRPPGPAASRRRRSRGSAPEGRSVPAALTAGTIMGDYSFTRLEERGGGATRRRRLHDRGALPPRGLRPGVRRRDRAGRGGVRARRQPRPRSAEPPGQHLRPGVPRRAGKGDRHPARGTRGPHPHGSEIEATGSAACSPSAPARSRSRALITLRYSGPGVGADARPSASSARASPSTPAASRSSPRAAWS